MSIVAAILTALAIVCTQALHGGLLVPAFSVPGDFLLAIAGAAALWAAIRNPAPTAPGALIAMTILVGYIAWRCVHASDQFLGRIELGQVLGAGLAFAIGFGGLTSHRARFIFLGLVIAVAAVQAVVGFFQFAQGGPAAPLGWMAADLRPLYESRFATRAHGFYLNPNHFAWLTGWAALFCVSLAAWGRVKVITRVVLIYLALMFIGAEVLSGSRGGMASLIGGFAVFSAISIVGVLGALRRGRIFALTGAAILVALCLATGAYVYSSNWMVQGRVDAWQTADVRDSLFEHARRQFETAPLAGQGPGTFVYAARLYRTGYQADDALFAHNDWLQTLGEYGFVGWSISLLTVLILLGGGAGRFFQALRRRTEIDERPQSNAAAILIGAISATVAFAAHSLTDFNMHVPANALLAGATLGLLAGTGGEPVGPRRLQAGVLRAFSGGVIACLTLALGLFVGRHGVADHQSLLAANALAEGNVRLALTHAEAGLQRVPNDAALLASRARALYSWESALQFENQAEAAADDGDEPGENADDIEASEEEPGEAGSTDNEDDAGDELAPEERRKLYQEAADGFSAVLGQQPRERKYLLELANANVELGKPKEAERRLIEAIELDPAHSYTYAAYGDYLYQNEKLERAQRVYSIGAWLPRGEYCGERMQDIREEMAPTPDDEPSSDSEEGAAE